MARLDIPSHPHRVFKDQTWTDDYKSAYGWRALADHGDTPARYGDLWAFAVEFNVDSDSEERRLFDDIVNLHPPFVAAEIVKLGGAMFAIGFHPEPDDDDTTAEDWRSEMIHWGV